MFSCRKALCACPVVVAAAFAVAVWKTPSAAQPPAQEAPPKTDTQPAAPEPVPHHAFGSFVGVRPAEGERIPTMKGSLGFEFPIQARVGVSPAGTAGGHSFALAFEVKSALGKRVTQGFSSVTLAPGMTVDLGTWGHHDDVPGEYELTVILTVMTPESKSLDLARHTSKYVVYAESERQVEQTGALPASRAPVNPYESIGGPQTRQWSGFSGNQFSFASAPALGGGRPLPGRPGIVIQPQMPPARPPFPPQAPPRFSPISTSPEWPRIPIPFPRLPMEPSPPRADPWGFPPPNPFGGPGTGPAVGGMLGIGGGCSGGAGQRIEFTTGRLMQMAKARGVIDDTMNPLERNRRVGRAFQEAITQALGVKENGKDFYSPLRDGRTGGSRNHQRSVRPDLALPIKTWVDNGIAGTKVVFEDSCFVEVKAVAGEVTQTHSNWQTAGFIDHLNAESPLGKESPKPNNMLPILVYVTTADTVMGKDVIGICDWSGIQLWQTKAYVLCSDDPAKGQILFEAPKPLTANAAGTVSPLGLSKGVLPRTPSPDTNPDPKEVVP
jgi:hypothetical protein